MGSWHCNGAAAGHRSSARTRMQSLARQAFAMEGTRPSMLTRARSTNTPNGRPKGEPCHTMTNNVPA